MTSTEMLNAAVREALHDATHPDPGQNAGEIFMTLASQRGLLLSAASRLYECAINHAAIADVITTAIRKPGGSAWLALGIALDGYQPSCSIDPSGTLLRRFLAVSSWNSDREMFERMSWYGIGETARYGMPLQIAVAIAGSLHNGRRHGYWSQALTANGKLRFRRKSKKDAGGFADTWTSIWREEHAEIDRATWLSTMLADGVLQDSLFVVNVPVPGEIERAKILELASRQQERLARLQETPEKQLAGCFEPVAPCPFQACCWGSPEQPPGPEHGFDSA